MATSESFASGKNLKLRVSHHGWFSAIYFGSRSVNKTTKTVIFVVLFALLPLAIPRLQQKLSVKGQAYREMLPDAHELIAFKHQSVSATTLATSETVENSI